ncbi:MAG: transglutaminase family protein [Epsilonproteobacteria bacterium]|nr:transglutaminase family protein [Campylobacterota bacterium]OIO16386.1 MAG: transglutaminase [Helicobacteraceae bacterium CG1_02_36_14]PIP11334.1 MAG: transglutaminase [Sulfurimonas sp. CG23_combo_of_CG06-09_8_20_14_all_36_33]PIS26018.1 MAG: transglutaminase [Sulfurimonas sp. CG08_land_8_20_14_0_20_36_33]PIU35679.1 MAG: transglutaminase [Sulfurimonas sp. CG07_land_8_20_14_0_80_36_56]PIV04878.1 MAG: transglutaminase [Sulfurimonas sp. CG03_land_8_20_14_0_80_36_25]PIV34434.1 MAG: transglutami
MIYDIYHKTEFKYQSSVTFSHNLARLKPKETPFQKLLEYSMEISPTVYESYDFVDMFGNSNTHILIREPHQTLTVIGKSKVEILTDGIEEYIENIQKNSISYESALKRLSTFNLSDLYAKQYLFESELIPNNSFKIKEYALESFHKKRDLFEATTELMNRIFNDFKFLSGFSNITTPVEEIFEAKKGVCQDFAQFAISALRTIGLPAKYMSGYIETVPLSGEKKLFGVDASHAWFSIYIPNAGWIDFDPTNNIIPKEQHILLGSGRDYHDISPLKGVVFSSGNSNLSVMVDVRKAQSETKMMMQMQQSQSQ